MNPDHSTLLKQLTFPMPSPVNTATERVSEPFRPVAVPSTVDEQSQAADVSPINVESIVSQSSDEEAVIKELIKMMEKSDEYETQLVDSPMLDVSHTSISGNNIDQTSPQPTSLRHMDSENSPFIPAKHSSPEEKGEDISNYYAKAPGKQSVRAIVS